jgi:hypothetical protein
MSSIVNGMFWLVRAGGLRGRLELLEELGQRLQQLERQLGTREALAGNALDDIRQGLRQAQRHDSQARWAQAGDLRAFEKRASSQNGEDGILREILNRVGAGSRFFVEFGVETGVECNCALLAREEGWQGLFLESEEALFRSLVQNYRDRPGARCVQARVTSASIEALLEAHSVPPEFDLLSIDIDGNDYWVWAAIRRWRPRIVVIEYNASHPPPRRWVMCEDVNYRWNGTNYHGASLASLAALGRAKGYTLVATDSRGVNAFFVRDDQVREGAFLDPALHYHYSPPAFGPHLGGHPAGSGPFVEV